MKKYITVAAAVMIFAGIAIFHTQLKDLVTSEKPVSKSISLAVYKASDYLSAVYNDASAKLRVTVTKVRGNTRTVVWDKTFNALQLKQYPTLRNALSQKIIINNILDNREHLEVDYTLTYVSKGNVLQMHNGVLVSKGTNEGTLHISI